MQRTLGVTADGIFGPNTRQAVINFQRNNGLGVDGIVGPETWNRLF
ncbi:peptidoglycan-binding domain-containing protein [Terribacillus saccharophilus]|nr:peptidoglycan-binding domain-containing protein [Terribacillus saccharophilus]